MNDQKIIPWQLSSRPNPDSFKHLNIFGSTASSNVALAWQNAVSSSNSTEMHISKKSLLLLLISFAFFEKYWTNWAISFVSDPFSGTHTLWICRASIFLYTCLGISFGNLFYLFFARFNIKNCFVIFIFRVRWLSSVWWHFWKKLCI